MKHNSYHLPGNTGLFQEFGDSLPLQREAADIGRITTRCFVVIHSDTSFVQGLGTARNVYGSATPKRYDGKL